MRKAVKNLAGLINTTAVAMSDTKETSNLNLLNAFNLNRFNLNRLNSTTTNHSGVRFGRLRFLKVASIILCIALSSYSIMAQMRDVIHLKNGSIIRGMITEQIPNVSYKIETADGNVMVYTPDAIQKIEKEAAGKQKRTSSSSSNAGSSTGIRLPQVGDWTVGFNLAYWMLSEKAGDDNLFGVSPTVSYIVSPEFRLEASFSLVSSSEELIGGHTATFTYTDFSVNAHYLFPFEATGSIFYIVGGLGFTKGKVEANKTILLESDMEAGFNLGVGYNWRLTDNWFINSELKLKKLFGGLFDGDGVIIPWTIGVSYRFDR